MSQDSTHTAQRYQAQNAERDFASVCVWLGVDLVKSQSRYVAIRQQYERDLHHLHFQTYCIAQVNHPMAPHGIEVLNMGT